MEITYHDTIEGKSGKIYRYWGEASGKREMIECISPMQGVPRDYMWKKIQEHITYVMPEDRKRIQSHDISAIEFDKIYKDAANDDYDHSIIHATNEARRERLIKEKEKEVVRKKQLTIEEMVTELIKEGTIYPIYMEEREDMAWMVEFPGGGEELGPEGSFSWKEIKRIFERDRK